MKSKMVLNLGSSDPVKFSPRMKNTYTLQGMTIMVEMNLWAEAYNVSEKLAGFFNTYEEGSSEDGIESEDDACQKQLETQEIRAEGIYIIIHSQQVQFSLIYY
ncbi:uncharacterized protein LOC129284359 [Prosopis cineraria]|uniref:uncharacterized protein LOC129284359 n=1 Tax=Prosopis cineraria TaxID=364024 RepID=UPI0024100D7E|nr:uncharacterized protein LOC129284359 [Prosopis cineraria]